LCTAPERAQTLLTARSSRSTSASWIRGALATIRGRAGFAGELRDSTSGFPDEQHACHPVPRLVYRFELARRYLHVFGPTTAKAFAQWAGISPQRGVAAFDALRKWLTPVRTPVGDAWILNAWERAI
jgi:hypothetical protein